MDNFRNLYESFDNEIDPEYTLSEKLESIIEQDYIEQLKDEFWFDDSVFYNIGKVIEWFQTHRPDLYKEALVDPNVLEGRDEVGEALQNLGYMVPWVEMKEEELQTPEDIERWRIAMGYYKEE